MKKVLALCLALATLLVAATVGAFAGESEPVRFRVEFEHYAQVLKDAGLNPNNTSGFQDGGDYSASGAKILACWSIPQGSVFEMKFEAETAGTYSFAMGWVSHDSSYGIWDVAINGTRVLDDLSTKTPAGGGANRGYIAGGVANVELEQGENTLTLTACREGNNTLKLDYAELTLVQATVEETTTEATTTTTVATTTTAVTTTTAATTTTEATTTTPAPTTAVPETEVPETTVVTFTAAAAEGDGYSSTWAANNYLYPQMQVYKVNEAATLSFGKIVITEAGKYSISIDARSQNGAGKFEVSIGKTAEDAVVLKTVDLLTDFSAKKEFNIAAFDLGETKLAAGEYTLFFKNAGAADGALALGSATLTLVEADEVLPPVSTEPPAKTGDTILATLGLLTLAAVGVAVTLRMGKKVD